MSKFLLLLSVILWGTSLTLPWFTHGLSLKSNPKYSFCEAALREGYLCNISSVSETGTSFSCWSAEGNSEKRNATGMSQKEVKQFCGDAWNAPRSVTEHGYEFLKTGWGLGILTLNAAWFAFSISWYAHIFWLLSLANGFMKHYKRAFNFGFISLGMALTALFSSRNEDLNIDYLGTGYYVWLLAMLIPGLVAYFEKSRGGQENSQQN